MTSVTTVQCELTSLNYRELYSVCAAPCCNNLLALFYVARW